MDFVDFGGGGLNLTVKGSIKRKKDQNLHFSAETGTQQEGLGELCTLSRIHEKCLRLLARGLLPPPSKLAIHSFAMN